jgi:hypothetical protein
VTREVLQQIVTCKTVAVAWKTIEGSFGSQTRARVVNVHLALATAQKGDMSITEFITKMRALGDEMAAASKPLDDEEMVSHILTDLDNEYNSVVSAILARVEPISVNELYGQLLRFESRHALLGGNMLSTNAAMRGRGGFTRGCGNGRGGGCGHIGGRNNNSNNYGSNSNNHNNGRGNFNNGGKHLMCQVYEKEGHTAVQCWYCFDESYGTEKRDVAATTHSYVIDRNWYNDTGATDHITSELEKLDMRTKYNGNDQVLMASGAGMNIAHIGRLVISTPTVTLFLKIFCMFLMLIKTSYLSIDLLPIIMHHLNTFSIFSWLRISTQGGRFLKDGVAMDSILFHPKLCEDMLFL